MLFLATIGVVNFKTLSKSSIYLSASTDRDLHSPIRPRASMGHVQFSLNFVTMLDQYSLFRDVNLLNRHLHSTYRNPYSPIHSIASTSQDPYSPNSVTGLDQSSLLRRVEPLGRPIYSTDAGVSLFITNHRSQSISSRPGVVVCLSQSKEWDPLLLL
jgi:hypothetical protein